MIHNKILEIQRSNNSHLRASMTRQFQQIDDVTTIYLPYGEQDFSTSFESENLQINIEMDNELDSQNE